MATNQNRWMYNIDGASEPLRLLIPTKAGSTTAIKAGEMCKVGKTYAGYPTPVTSGDATAIVIAEEEQKSTDPERMLHYIIPRPGDVFEFALSAARAVVLGETLAVSNSETLAYAVSNVVARICATDNCPVPAEKSVTRRSVSRARVNFDDAASYWGMLTGNS